MMLQQTKLLLMHKGRSGSKLQLLILQLVPMLLLLLTTVTTTKYYCNPVFFILYCLPPFPLQHATFHPLLSVNFLFFFITFSSVIISSCSVLLLFSLLLLSRVIFHHQYQSHFYFTCFSLYFLLVTLLSRS